MSDKKRFHIKTFGCQMNVYDSERMAESLAGLGFAETADMADADLVVLNTCHIREKAAEKVYSDLGRVREIKDERQSRGHEILVAVTGCVAQAEGAEIMARAPVVDLLVGPQSYHKLPDLLERAQRERRGVVETAFPDDEKFAKLPERSSARPGAASAFLTIQEGCDKFCTFCVVPYTRGAEYSRGVAEIVAEASTLASRGVREITLLGQNVNAYHGAGPDGTPATLASLVRRLAEIEGLERIRYTTSHPRDMSDDLIRAHRDVDKLMPYLHLPFQAGADRILAAMNRKHSATQYRALVQRIRAARPDIALSTDIIVGFPGETEAEFQQTLEMVSDVGFAAAYTFKYSPRPGTPAATMDGQVDEAEKSDRLARLSSKLEAAHAAYNASAVGRTLPVLFEKAGRQAGLIVGRTPYLQHVSVAGSPALIGEIRPVEIVSALPYSLNGSLAA